MGLMCDRRLDFAALSAALGVDVAKEYAKEIAGLADLEADGLLVCTADGIEVLPRGVPLLRVIAMRFDATFVPGARAPRPDRLTPRLTGLGRACAARAPGLRPVRSPR